LETDTTRAERAAASPAAPLRGVRIVEFGQFIAVPAAAQALGDLGADIIKVEPPSGDVARSSGWTHDAYGPMFTAYNRGKRSVVLDLRSDQGRRAAFHLSTGADVVLQNMRPGVMAKLGLGSDELMNANPRLVYGQVSGFGQTGATSARPGLDIAAQAESGMMSINGAADGEPTRVGFTVVDVMAAQTLSTGILAALLRRASTGRGGLVDVSLIDVAVAAMSNTWADYRLTGALPVRAGNGQPFAAPAADVFTTANGKVVISAYTQDHFSRLCTALDLHQMPADPRFCTNEARVGNRAAMQAALAPAILSMETDVLCERLSNAGVVVGAVRTMAEVSPGRTGVSEDLFVPVRTATREPVGIPGLPLRLDGLTRSAGYLPALGEHTDEILAELLMTSRLGGACHSPEHYGVPTTKMLDHSDCTKLPAAGDCWWPTA
jgi:crotonobetainyl-CoA:carnitine CoA-transferase CaiB-like acyl-CoA transferase